MGRGKTRVDLYMEKQKYSLRTNIGYFIGRPIGFSKDFQLEYPEIFIEPDLNVYHLASNYRFSRTREGLLLQAELQGEVDYNCVLCLSPFLVDVKTSFEELYVFSQRSQDDLDLVIPEDGYIDLGEIFREYLLLEIPINAVCKPDCKGLCPQCGQNLNEKACEHSTDH
jgi:uncharacterized protein